MQIEKILNHVDKADIKNGTFEIPDDIHSIGSLACHEICEELKQITIPENVCHIYDRAFQCTNLESVTILSEIIIIDEGAFRYNPNLKIVKLPNAYDRGSIHKGAFDENVKIEYGKTRDSSIDALLDLISKREL